MIRISKPLAKVLACYCERADEALRSETMEDLLELLPKFKVMKHGCTGGAKEVTLVSETDANFIKVGDEAYVIPLTVLQAVVNIALAEGQRNGVAFVKNILGVA